MRKAVCGDSGSASRCRQAAHMILRVGNPLTLKNVLTASFSLAVASTWQGRKGEVSAHGWRLRSAPSRHASHDPGTLASTMGGSLPFRAAAALAYSGSSFLQCPHQGAYSCGGTDRARVFASRAASTGCRRECWHDSVSNKPAQQLHLVTSTTRKGCLAASSFSSSIPLTAITSSPRAAAARQATASRAAASLHRAMLQGLGLAKPGKPPGLPIVAGRGA